MVQTLTDERSRAYKSKITDLDLPTPEEIQKIFSMLKREHLEKISDLFYFMFLYACVFFVRLRRCHDIKKNSLEKCTKSEISMQFWMRN